MSLYRSNMGHHSIVTMVELVGMPRPRGGAGCRVGGPKSAEFLLHVLRNAESNAGLKGLDPRSLSISWEQSPEDAAWDLDQPRNELPLPR